MPGLALALELARRGVATAVVGDPPPERPSGPGLVNPQARLEVPPEPLQDLALLSRHLWGEWVAAVEEDAGFSCEYEERGGLVVARTEAEEVALDELFDWQRARGLAVEALSADEALEREGALSGAIHGAFGFPHDGQVDPCRLASALVLAARKAGAELALVPVTGFLTGGGRLEGVLTPLGSVSADAVVETGLWPRRVAGLVPSALAAVTLDDAGRSDRLFRFVLSPGLALVPRRDGTLLASAPDDPEAFGLRPTAEAVARALTLSGRLLPGAARAGLASVARLAAEAAPDGLPVLGESARPGLHLLGALGPDEVLLTPAVSVLLADVLTGQAPPLPPGAFSPSRFGA